MKKNKKIKRIGIDARFYGPLGKGLGRYTQEIVDNVIKIDKENKYIVFLSPENFDEFICDGKRIKKIMVKAKWYTLKEQIFFPYLIFKQRLDLIHFPHFNIPLLTPVKFTVTIHDLILTRFPTQRATTLNPFFYKIKNWGYKIVINTAVRRAKKIIAVSNFTKNDIVKKFKVKPDKIEVTYEGVANLAKGNDHLFVSKLDDKETLLSYNIDKNFFLYVGNAYPHKNLEWLVECFFDISQKFPDIHLVLVGIEDYFYKRVKEEAKKYGLWEENKENTKIIFPGYVPDNKLEILYKQALCYIFPSLYEGFGLPPLEAMAKGCPVLSSNQASLPEVLGDAAMYFNPKQKEDLIKKAEKIISNKELSQELARKGLKQVKKYNWWECARKTQDIYNKILFKDVIQ